MYTGTLDVINSTFIGNRARRGGAINSAGAQTNLTHISVSGGGLSIHDEDGTLRLRNSIVYTDDSLEGCHGVLTQNIGNLISDGSCDPAYRGDPLFGESTGDPVYLPLQVGSPAINAAHPAFCPATDQKGAPRPQDGGCDIGAIEMPPVVSDISDCLVATTHNLNFRDGPGGNRIGGVPQGATLSVKARTPRWFQVEHEGQSGWISAAYVVAQGECG